MESLTFLITTTFYPPYHLGGDAVHVKYLADDLVKRGHEVHVLHSLDAYKIKRKALPEKDKADGVHTTAVKTIFNNSSYIAYTLGNSSVVNKKFISLIKQIKPDIVHHHNISLLGYNILKKAGAYRNLYTAHDYWVLCQQNNLFKNDSEVCSSRDCFFCSLKRKKTPQLWRNWNGYKVALNDIDAIIAPSTCVKDQISYFLGRDVKMIPNFVPKLPIASQESPFTNFFLYAGSLEPHKGVLDLLDAYREVCNKTSAQLLIAGEGSLSGEIKQHVRTHGLEKKVVVLGRVENNLLYRLLRDANALVMPSRWPENCPLIALESLSLGTPVIGSNIGGLPEIIDKISTNLTYNSTSRLKDILVNFSKAQFPSYTTRAIYSKYYSPDAFLKSYNNLAFECT